MDNLLHRVVDVDVESSTSGNHHERSSDECCLEKNSSKPTGTSSQDDDETTISTEVDSSYQGDWSTTDSGMPSVRRMGTFVGHSSNSSLLLPVQVLTPETPTFHPTKTNQSAAIPEEASPIVDHDNNHNSTSNNSKDCRHGGHPSTSAQTLLEKLTAERCRQKLRLESLRSKTPTHCVQRKTDASTGATKTKTKTTNVTVNQHHYRYREKNHQEVLPFQNDDSMQKPKSTSNSESDAVWKKELDDVRRQIEFFQTNWNMTPPTTGSQTLILDVGGESSRSDPTPSESPKVENVIFRPPMGGIHLGGSMLLSPSPMWPFTMVVSPSWIPAIPYQNRNVLLTEPQSPCCSLNNSKPFVTSEHEHQHHPQTRRSLNTEEAVSTSQQTQQTTLLQSEEHPSTSETLMDAQTIMAKDTTEEKQMDPNVLLSCVRDHVDIDDMKEVCNNDNDEVKELTTINAELEEKIQQLQTMWKTQKEETETVRYQSLLQKKADAFLVEAFEKRQAETRIEMQELQTKNQELVEGEKLWKKALEDYQASIAVLRLDKTRLLHELQEERRATQESEQEKMRVYRLYEALSQEVRSLREQVVFQNRELMHAADIKASNEKLTSDCEQLQLSLAKSTEHGTNQESMILQLETSLQEANETISRLEDEKERAVVECDEVKTIHEEFKTRLESIEKMHSDCVREMQSTIFGIW